MTGRVLAVLCLPLAVLMAGCSDSGIEGERYEGDGYSLVVPDGWSSEQGTYGEFWVGRASEGENDDFIENVNLMIESIPAGMNEARYLDLSKQNMAEIPGFDLLEEEEVSINGLDGVRLHYQANVYGQSLDNDAYILMEDSQAYILTLTAREGESREQWMPELTQVAETFQLE